MSEPAKEFVPSPKSKDCSQKAGGWGRPVTNPEFIWYGNKGEDDYPKDACVPWYHRNAQIDNFQVNTLLTSTKIECPDIQGVINQQSWKGFDIKHPNKEHHRLRHICLEGPEAGVYIRGRLTNSNIIELPEYWRGLIDPETITVTLTQIGSSQDLIIDAIEWGQKVKIRSGNASNIDCYYIIQAARIDGEPLIVEYEGDTPAKYPGSPDQFSISGYDYDARG
tara:strand:- start:181 stop:846 length:666 start_codon:yes stop_codon:yes gene_type:complete